MITEPGIYPDITPTEYFSGQTPTPALSNSGIKRLLGTTPADFKYGDNDKESAALRMGDLTHQLALGKGSGYEVSPYDAYRTNEAKAWRDGVIASGKLPVKEAEFTAAEAMASILRARIDEMCQGCEWMAEVPMYWQETTPSGTIWMQGMMDVFCPDLDLVIDPKVTARMYDDRLTGHFDKMGWAGQSTLYRRGLGRIFPEKAGRFQFVNLLVNPNPPHTHRAVTISEAWRSVCEMDINRAINLFAKCQASGEWPGFGDDVEQIDPPAWTVRQAMEREMMEDEGEEE